MKAGRPRQFDESTVRERLMESFWKLGFEDNTFERLVSESGLSRSSLYSSFGGKDALFDLALDTYIQERFTKVKARLESDATSNKALADFVRTLGKSFDPERKDCLLRKTMLHNASRRTPPVGLERLRSYVRDLWRALTASLTHRPSPRNLRLSDEERGALLIAAFFGSAVISRTGGNPELLAAIERGAGELALAQAPRGG